MTRRDWALFAAMCVIWGVPYLLIRIAVRDVTPGTLVFLRTGIGGLLLVPFALRANGAAAFRAVARRWRPLIAFAVIEMAVPWLLLSAAEQQLASSLTGLLIAAVPLVSVVVARVTGSQDRADALQLLGLGLGIVGVALLVGLDLGTVHAGPLLELLVVVIGYAVAPAILARRLADLPNLPVVCSALLVVAAGYLPYAVLRPPTRVGADAWWSIVALAVVCTALAFVVFFALIAAIGPARATIITYVNPAVAVACGVAFLDERFTVGMAVGFPLILAGSVLGARRRERVAPAAAVPLATVAAQSSRTGPRAVSNSADTTPTRPPTGTSHSRSTSPSG